MKKLPFNKFLAPKKVLANSTKRPCSTREQGLFVIGKNIYFLEIFMLDCPLIVRLYKPAANFSKLIEVLVPSK